MLRLERSHVPMLQPPLLKLRDLSLVYKWGYAHLLQPTLLLEATGVHGGMVLVGPGWDLLVPPSMNQEFISPSKGSWFKLQTPVQRACPGRWDQL